MQQFTYKARDAAGKLSTGKMLANDRVELSAMLRQKEMSLVSVLKSEDGKKGKMRLPDFLQKVGLVDKMLFTRNLGVMLNAGLPFSRALSVLSEQAKSSYFREILKEVSENVQKGNSLADSLEKYPKVFNRLFVSMVRVGESGGNLEEVLRLLAVQLKKDHEINSKVKGAMSYPCVILAAMALVGIIMMVFVFPSLLKMFAESGKELPFTTRALIFISDALRSYGIYMFAALIIFFAAFLRFIKTSAGKKVFDGLILRIPVFGEIIMKVNVARFCRTLSSMIASGVPIIQALETVSSTLGNYYYGDSAAKACLQVEKGVDLSEVLKGYGKLYPGMMINMIEVGEETGSVEKTLAQVAEYYEEEVDQFTSSMSSVIEPILMLLMGGAVGIFALALIQPMYSIMETV